MSKIHERNKAKELRAVGSSIKEIARTLRVSQSTASIWVRTVELSSQAKRRIEQKRIDGRKRATQILQGKRVARQEASRLLAHQLRGLAKPTTSEKYMLASMIYECEGGKGGYGVLEFTNSDPVLVKIFLTLLRKTFTLDESKFRVVMHLHSYHNEEIERAFWSKVCAIPKNKFLKTYQKKESGIRKKINYRGCVQIKYFDVNIKRVLLAGKNILAGNLGL